MLNCKKTNSDSLLLPATLIYCFELFTLSVSLLKDHFHNIGISKVALS